MKHKNATKRVIPVYEPQDETVPVTKTKRIHQGKYVFSLALSAALGFAAATYLWFGMAGMWWIS
jgi:hypothetical protein